MLKKTITYEDFDGETLTETFYFNLSKRELMELEVGFEAGLEDWLKTMMKTEDRKQLLEIFQKIVLSSYGVQSDDKKRFIKSEELTNDFKHHAAYDVLFMEIATNETVMAAFINGIMPKDLTEKADQDKPTSLPPKSE